VAIPLLVLYVFATGAHAGAVRALVMATVWLIGWMLVRPADLLNDLAAAALVLLLWNPEQLFDGGFLLSFQVVTAMVVLTPLIQSRLLPLVSPDPLRPRKLTPRWQLRIERPVKRIVQLLSCSLAAWIGLVPLLAFYFHLFTPISVIANLLVIPLLTGVIALGLTATLASAIWPWLTATFNNAALVLLAVMTRGVEWLGKVPGGHQFVQTPPLWLIVGYYVLAILLLSRGIPWSWRRWMAAIAVPTACVAAVFMAWPGEVAEITVLDLNDGSSIFVNLPGERDDWLIDGGGNGGGERTVVPFLRAQGVDKLDALVLTCGDGAHAAGLTTVANEIPCARMIESGVPARSKFYGSWQQAVKHQGKTMRYLRAGDEMTVANKLKVRALNPSSVVSGSRTDDNSLVLMLESGSTRLLLMSDAGETVENRLLRSGEALHAKIILKGRHGKEPSCTDAFLDAVRPEIVVQSVSARPSDRYLEPDLRDRLQQRNVKLYRTDETGAVTIRLTSKGYTVETWVK
jgi:competence protein ComEC